ncbi:Ig-like domain-containing protein [Pseudomonas rubra]|uniref:Ig-like domain-containing protein n=1 Tax=Pseudomonas rubra TaxID=2942627 RepID=UPI003B670F5B
MSLKVGASKVPSYSVEPEGAVIVWSSDSPEVATVDSTGSITAVAPGTANVSATFGSLSATCKLTVTA